MGYAGVAPVTRRRTVALATGLLGGLAGGAENRDGAEENRRDGAEKDHDVHLVDGHDESHTVHLEITHEGEPIHEQRVETPPGMDAAVYNFRRSPVDGVATYVVATELGDGPSECIGFRTTSCSGHVVVPVDDDGELNVSNSIC